ncbi:MAG: protease modulator HflC [Planctomycetes bacterium]|nr:protease modulator HflC [Planctomycetota bacterium]
MSTFQSVPQRSTSPRAVLTGVLIALVALLALITVSGGFFVVDAGEQAVVLQFQRPVGEAISAPGLHFKLPFLQDVTRFDRRLLSWDGEPDQITTRGREFISVETTARWRIADPLKFLQSVRDEAGARSRLDDVLDSVVRDKVSSTELVEIVRSASWAVVPEDLEREVVSQDAQNELGRKVAVGREGLERAILDEAIKAVPAYGIELIDVRIKRLNYVKTVQTQVFDRMISERQRIAAQFRSEGEGEASRIRGDTARELASLRSEAKRQAEVVRGEADAEATRVYAEAYGADPEFFEYLRTLESYGRSLGERTTLVLSADGGYFDLLRGGARR